MNTSRLWLLSLFAAFLTQAAAAAPVPIGTPASLGPISDFLQRRDRALLAAPHVTSAVMPEESSIRIGRRVLAYQATEQVRTEYVTVAKEVIEKVKLPGGKIQEVKRVVTETQPVQRKVLVNVPVERIEMVTMKAEACKFFLVTKDGKLEALDTAKAAPLLKKATPVLTGDSAEVDPRSLELVKPGTLFVVFVSAEPDAVVAPRPEK
jgi:hypothetical protein